MTRSCLDFDPFCEVCDRTVGPIQLTFDARTSDLTDAEHAELEATPSLAERIDVFLAAPGVSDATSDDLLRAAAAQLRQLRQLDRIKAAAGDARAVADALIESGDIVVPTSAPAAVDLLLRLADALEADDGA